MKRSGPEHPPPDSPRGAVPRSGERSPNIPHPLKPSPPLPSPRPLYRDARLFVASSPPQPRTRKRSPLCRRPLPPRSPSKPSTIPQDPQARAAAERARSLPPLGIPPSVGYRPFLASTRLAPGPPPQGCAARSAFWPPDLGRPPPRRPPSHRGRAPTPSWPPPHPERGAGSPGSAPTRPLAPRSFVRRARAASRRGRHSHARSPRRARAPGAAGREAEGAEAAAAESNRSLPPRPRGAASAIAESRAGTRRLGARRSPDLPKPGAGECGRPRGPGGAGPFPPGAGSGAAGLPRRQRRESPGAAAPGPGTSPDWPGAGSAPSPSRGRPCRFVQRFPSPERQGIPSHPGP